MEMLFYFNILMPNPMNLPIGIVMPGLGACLLAVILSNKDKNFTLNPVQANGML